MLGRFLRLVIGCLPGTVIKTPVLFGILPQGRAAGDVVGPSYTETRRRQLYPAATHRNMSPGDHIWDIIHDHVQADLQCNLDDLIR